MMANITYRGGHTISLWGCFCFCLVFVVVVGGFVLWNLSSPIRNQTHAPCSGNVES